LTNPALCQSLVDAFIAGLSVTGSVSTSDNDEDC
jgi:hypothetical protein